MSDEVDVYKNGKLVGSMPYTGNNAIDSKSAKNLLIKKGLLNTSSELDSILRQARSFGKAARELRKHECHEFMVPFIVNGCFCIELLLKALHIKNNSKKSGHELKKLYDQLPLDLKNSLGTKFISSNYKSLDEEISNLSSVFVEWRYMHEKEETTVVSSSMILPIINTLLAEF